MSAPERLLCAIFLFSFLFSLSIGIGTAIDISFSGSNHGESVGLSDIYNLDTGVSVGEGASLDFQAPSGSPNMTDSREVHGSGNANMYQAFYGTGGGADFKGINILKTINAGNINDHTCLSLNPTYASASRSSSSRPRRLWLREARSRV